jgi:hypothetical protein
VSDKELGELMKRAMAEVFPATGALVTRAEQEGRRLRRRRLVWIVGGNAAVVVAIAALIATFAHLPTAGGPRPSGLRLGGGLSPSASGQATASASPTVPPSPEPPMTATQMLAVLRSMLPADSVFSDLRSTLGPGSIEVNYNDGNGLADVMIAVMVPTAAETNDQLSCPNPPWTDEGPRPAGALPISCQVRTLPDGSIERDAVMYADAYGFYGYDIYDLRPDGVEVFIQVGDGYFDPYLPDVTRPTPPGSMALWEEVVESPAWHA